MRLGGPHLLDRYGLVSKSIAAGDRVPLPWSQLYPDLKRMELRGEIRRGHFVAGLKGVQFARLEAIKRNTWRFAKRQRTWYRREPGVVWLDAAVGKEVLTERVAELWAERRG